MGFQVSELVKDFVDDLCSLNEYFFYCLRNSLSTRGIQLDISGIYEMSEFLTERSEDIELMPKEWLMGIDFGDESTFFLENIVSILPEDAPDAFHQSSMVDNFLVNVLGEYAARLLCRETVSNLKISLGSLYSSSSIFHIKLFSTIKTVTWLRDRVSLMLMKVPQLKIDLELEETMIKAVALGTIRGYSLTDRLDAMKKEFPVGSIVCIYERDLPKNMKDLSRVPVGFISSQRVVEVLGYSNTGFKYRAFGCMKSKAELLRQFNQISEDKQDAFTDLQNPKMSIREGFCSLYDTSVSWKIAPTDTNMVWGLNEREMVQKEFFVDECCRSLRLTAPQAVFLLFREYGVKFNEDLFLKMYRVGSVADINVC